MSSVKNAPSPAPSLGGATAVDGVAPAAVENKRLPPPELAVPLAPLANPVVAKRPDLATAAVAKALDAATYALHDALGTLPPGVQRAEVHEWLQANALPRATDAFMWAAIATFAKAGEANARVWASDLCDHFAGAASKVVARLHADPKTRPLSEVLRTVGDYLNGAPNVTREQALAATLALSENAPAVAAPLTTALQFVSATRDGDALVSFVDAALFGSKAKSQGVAAIAGQATTGFIPIAGQIADARDIAHALQAFARGEPDARAALLLSAAALIPGFDFLKRDTVLSAKQLQQAGTTLGAGADEGLAVLRKALPADLFTTIDGEVRALNVARNELIARIENTLSAFPPNIALDLKSLRSGLRDNVEPDDLVGALREKRGIGPVWVGSGKQMDHGKKVRDFLNAYPRNAQSVSRKVQETPYESAARTVLSALYEVQKRALALLEK